MTLTFVDRIGAASSRRHNTHARDPESRPRKAYKNTPSRQAMAGLRNSALQSRMDGVLASSVGGKGQVVGFSFVDSTQPARG
jgi:hypothetical protein